MKAKKPLLGTTQKLLMMSFMVLLLTACSHEPMPEVANLVDQDRLLETDDFYLFTPHQAKSTCLIFYTGGLVEPMAYAPLLQSVADAGYPSFLIKSPFDLAIIDSDGADDINDAQLTEQNCEHLVVAGHSLGGVVAAGYVEAKPDYGLLLLAAYPQEDSPLTDHRGPIVSISASLDGLSTPDKMAAKNHLLPISAKRVLIDGGNHAQFGWYGVQDDDGVATISRQQQQDIVLQETLKLMNWFVKSSRMDKANE